MQAGWRSTLNFPVQIPFELVNDGSVGNKTLTVWFDNLTTLTDNASIMLTYDPIPATGTLEFTVESTNRDNVSVLLRGVTH